MAIAQDKHEHAAKILGTAAETREQLNAQSEDPREIAELAKAMEQMAGALGEEERDKILSEGRLISLDVAVEMALGETDA